MGEKGKWRHQINSCFLQTKAQSPHVSKMWGTYNPEQCMGLVQLLFWELNLGGDLGTWICGSSSGALFPLGLFQAGRPHIIYFWWIFLLHILVHMVFLCFRSFMFWFPKQRGLKAGRALWACWQMTASRSHWNPQMCCPQKRGNLDGSTTGFGFFWQGNIAKQVFLCYPGVYPSALPHFDVPKLGRI